MRLDKALHDREAEAETAVTAGRGAVGLAVSLE